ncbi:chitobiase/beta-hexosaminidase C-terminal domain-containing protein [Oryzihumus sp.]
MSTRRRRWLPWVVVPCALTLGMTMVSATPVVAATQTRVTLAFDNGSISQYTLGWTKALQPHGAKATFFVNSGTVSGGASFMTWAQLGTLAGDGQDIGGKTVNATNLTTDPNPTNQVCNDRAALISHGLSPAAFAYPGGTNNATVQAVVKSCGYGNARTAGGLSATGATYAETLPPTNWFATRAYAPSAVTLANMQSLVTGAATHNGGWTQIVIGRVCDQTLDAANYASCSASSGHIELADLNAFLDWVAAAGQAGGAPAGVGLDTVRGAATSADATAPTTAITCNGAACTNTPYTGLVSVSFSPSDVGSSISSTHYTTDGSDPTLSSPTWTGPFNVNGSSASTTVKFRSWDYAGNVEATQTQVIQAPTDSAAPTTTITCNGAACASTPYVGSVTVGLSATDTGGSGLDKTYYTTDGSTPTTSSSVYSAPFQLTSPATYAVRFFSTDKAGNAETVQSQSVQVVPVSTKVSLTFDNGTVSQYTLAWTKALQPHGAKASFFVNSGTIGVSANIMSWANLAALAADGQDIGGKTVNATNLTTDPNPTAQVCNDRAALIAHGLDPVAFAYPGGANNATVKDIVKTCGYGSGRSAGSLSPSGPTYAEALPPADWYATRAWAPSGQVTLANLKALVTGAASKGGGWSQVVIGRVCDQGLDAANYTACTASAGWVELADLNAFLDWIGNAGQSGGAPAGAALSTVRAAAISADKVAPVTAIACNGSACTTDTYTSTVSVTLPGSDVGSAIASTHYTTDGSDPTLSSPTYTKAFPITATTTVKFRSWDNAGNVEAVQTQVITASLPADTTAPTTAITCNGSPCTTTGYNGSATVTLTATDAGGWGVDKTHYTTDGSTPTTASAVYAGPLTLSTPATYTVKFFSVDLAGNTEAVQSQDIQVLPPQTVVSLTFDDGVKNQYTLGVKRGLQPRGMRGTFYDVSGLNDKDPQHMTWDELHATNNAGNEVGGHTLDHVNIKTLTDNATKVHEVCDDRQNLINHGFYPTSFAYPEGAYDATAESIVQGCGYSTGRAAGGIDVAGSGAGPVYAETIPPKDMFASRTVYDPPSGTPANVPPLTLQHLQDAVTAAAAHGGGWIVYDFHQVCSQAYDPDNYTSCMSDWGPIELDTLNAFLDWLKNAGQPGGAPVRTVVQTVSQTLNGPDLQAPISSVLCDGSPCASTTYNGSTTVSLTGKDPGGSGVKATYFTTDGSTPTTASPQFTKLFTINANTTFKFFSVDNDGNVEAVQTQQVLVQPNTDPVVGAAGDIACDPTAPAFNDGLGTDTDCRASQTVKLLTGVDAVLPLGDNQYECGGPAAYAQSYDPTWGVKKAITHPVPGDKDYQTTGGTDCPTTPGAGYYQYFGSAAGDPAKGYYSYDLGSWHVVALNTATCPVDPSFCAAGSAQEQWLQQDLAAHNTSCTLAYYQNPRWASTASGSGGDTTFQPIWQDLYSGGVDVVLNGDSHWYERFTPQDATGKQDLAHGVRQFIVGTGGAGLDTPGAPGPNSEALNATTHGVIKLTLHNGSYDWSFNPDEGTFTDSGSNGCHAAPPVPDTTAPTTVATCNNAPCTSTPYAPPVSVALTATDNVGGSGVSSTHYTTDGTDPTLLSPAYTAPLSLASSATVKYKSWDVAGNVEATGTLAVQVDTTAPVTSATCNGAACATTPYAAPVAVALSATDTGGLGVSSTHYTTDGSDPTLSSPTYTAPLSLGATTTVKFRSWDTAGNVEATRTQLVTVDATAPSTTITCNSAACGSAAYFSSVTIRLAATDDAGGSGVSSIHYTTDGTDPTLTSPTYTAAFTLTSSATVKYRAWDKVGNVEATKSQAIQVAADAPPVAALTLSPSTGMAPFAVTANASGSRDTDATPIASYTFAWGDGTASVTQAGASATHTYTRSGTFLLTVTVRDTAGLTGSATAQVVSKANLIANTGFESNTSGWAAASGCMLMRSSGGHSGSWSARVLNSGFTTRTCLLDDSPNQVSRTSAGTYTATLWVKGASSGATMNLRLREMSGSTVVGSATKTLILSTSWQPVTVTLTVQRPGSTALDLNAYVVNVGMLATAFYADDAALTLG